MIASFEKGNDLSLTVLLCEFHSPLAHPGKASGSQFHGGQRVFFMGIESGADEQDVWLKFFELFLHRTLERLLVCAFLGASSQGNIQSEALAGTLTLFCRCPGSRIEGKLMKANKENVGI